MTPEESSYHVFSLETIHQSLQSSQQQVVSPNMKVELPIESDTSLTLEREDTKTDAPEARNGRAENWSTPKDETKSKAPDSQRVGSLQVSDQAFLESPSVFMQMENAGPGAPLTQAPFSWELLDKEAEDMLFPKTNEQEDLPEGEYSGNREALPTSVSSSSTLCSPRSQKPASASQQTNSVSIAEAVSIVESQRASNTQGRRLRLGSPKWYFQSSSSSCSDR